MMRVADDREAGFTLVELLVYASLMVVILTIVGGFLLNSLVAQRDVESISSASSDGQLAVTAIENDVRNSSAFQVAASTTPAGQLIRARSADETAPGTLGWSCTAYFYAQDEERIYRTTSAAGAVAAPASLSALDSWTLLAEEVRLPSGASNPFTAVSGTQLRISFDAVAGSSAIRIETSVVPRLFSADQIAQAPTSCF